MSGYLAVKYSFFFEKNPNSCVTDRTCLNGELPTTLIPCENLGNILLSVDVILSNSNKGRWIFILNTKFYNIHEGCLPGNRMFVVTDRT